MINEVNNIEPGSRFTLLARIYDILSVIVKETDGKETLASTCRKDLLYKVGQVAQYIENNYHEQITLKKTAEKFDLVSIIYPDYLNVFDILFVNTLMKLELNMLKKVSY